MFYNIILQHIRAVLSGNVGALRRVSCVLVLTVSRLWLDSVCVDSEGHNTKKQKITQKISTVLFFDKNSLEFLFFYKEVYILKIYIILYILGKGVYNIYIRLGGNLQNKKFDDFWEVFWFRFACCFDVCDVNVSGWQIRELYGVYFCSCGFYFVTLWCWLLFLKKRYKKLFVFVLLKMFVFVGEGRHERF